MFEYARFINKKNNTLANITDKVFFDIKIDGSETGRVIFGLYGDVVPKTVANFAILSSGTFSKSTNKKPLHYKNSYFHRIIPKYWA